MVNYIIIRTLSKKLSKTIYDFEKDHKDVIAIEVAGQKKKSYSGAIRFYKDNGIILTYIAGLMEKYPNELEVYGAEKLFNVNLPKIVQKGGKWLAERTHRKLCNVARNIGTTDEELIKYKLGTKIPSHALKEETKHL